MNDERSPLDIGSHIVQAPLKKLFRLSVYDDKRFALSFYSLDSETFTRANDRIREFPERKWSRDLDCWLVPFSAANIEHLNEHFSLGEYDADEEAKLVLSYTKTRDQVAGRKERRRWEYIFEGKVPSLDGYSPYRLPYRHQTVALDAVHNVPHFALLMEMGTGKTKVVIDEAVWQANRRIEEGGRPYKVLIVCPRTVQRIWLREMEKDINPTFPYWADRVRTSVPGMRILLDMARANAPLKFCVINYEKLGPMAVALIRIKFDLMVLDESTKIKSFSARRTKNAFAVGESAGRRFILTGAPVTNTIIDLFSQFEFLESGCLGFSSHYAFKANYMRFAKLRGTRWEKLTGYQHLDELKRRMANNSFIVRKDQCLDLPAKTYETHYVELTEKQQELYEQMVEMFIASITAEADPNGTVSAPVVIVQMLRLCQICCGYIKSIAGEEVSIPGENPKITALMEILDDLPPDEKVVIWCRFRYDVRAIGQALDQARIGWVRLVGGMPDRERDRAVDLFNGKNHVRVLVGEPGTGGYGLTLLGHLENPCHVVIYYSNDFSLDKRVQSEDRVHRIGQTRPVTYIDIACEGTIEEKIAASLQEKRDLSEAMKCVESIKELLLGQVTKVQDMFIRKTKIQEQVTRVTSDVEGNVVVERKEGRLEI